MIDREEPPAPARRSRDGGYAMVAAITAVAAFAYIGFQIMAADRGDIAGVLARSEQARLMAAADAGVMLAIHGLGAEDAAQRWPIDGRTQQVEFAGADVAITVDDERGKAPLMGLNPAQSRALFEGAGADPDRVDALVNALRDFQSGEDEMAPDPARIAADPLGAAPVRQGDFRTVGDLMAFKDMDADLYARLAPAVTVFFEESGPFEPRHATPLAKAAMNASEYDPEDAALDASDKSDQQTQEPAEAIVDDNLVGRTLTVTSIARGRGGARAERSVIVELTGAADNPYWIRYTE